jgi:DNA-directed RNA polymerase alpha subunit
MINNQEISPERQILNEMLKINNEQMNNIQINNLEKTMAESLKKLSSRLQLIIHKRYYENMTLCNIAIDLEISHQRVVQLILEALNILYKTSYYLLLNIYTQDEIKNPKNWNDIYIKRSINLPQRTINILEDNNIKTLYDLSYFVNDKNRNIPVFHGIPLSRIVDRAKEIGVIIEDATNRFEAQNEDHISVLLMSNRTNNVLKRNGIFSIKDLKSKSIEELQQLNFLGEKVLQEILEKIA